MNKHMEAARASVAEKAHATDFAAMTADEFGAWVDALPRLEFIALLDMHCKDTSDASSSESAQRQAITADDPRDTWIDYDGDGSAPVPDDVIVWVTTEDGDILGPNRADAFLWGGPVSIPSYAVAKNVKPRGAHRL